MSAPTDAIAVAVEPLAHFEGLELPTYQTAGSAGMDVRAATEGSVTLLPGARVMVPTGLKMAVPPGFEMQVRPRSGLAIKHGVTVVNAPGTIDSDYRGEVMVGLVNLSASAFEVERGMRIAQFVLAPVTRAALHRADSLGETERGAGGFGSTGHR